MPRARAEPGLEVPRPPQRFVMEDVRSPALLSYKAHGTLTPLTPNGDKGFHTSLSRVPPEKSQGTAMPSTRRRGTGSFHPRLAGFGLRPWLLPGRRLQGVVSGMHWAALGEERGRWAPGAAEPPAAAWAQADQSTLCRRQARGLLAPRRCPRCPRLSALPRPSSPSLPCRVLAGRPSIPEPGCPPTPGGAPCPPCPAHLLFTCNGSA